MHNTFLCPYNDNLIGTITADLATLFCFWFFIIISFMYPSNFGPLDYGPKWPYGEPGPIHKLILPTHSTNRTHNYHLSVFHF